MSTGSPCFGVEFLLITLVYLGGGWASLSLLEAGPGKAQDHGHEVKVSSARLTPPGLRALGHSTYPDLTQSQFIPAVLA